MKMPSKTQDIAINGHSVDQSSFLLGLGLAVSSSLFIGSSFIIKKLALRRICATGNVRASAGGFGYLKEWLWWLGLITMGFGEAANLLAYAFAPAALVTPLGALSVLVAAILSSKFLHERLNIIGKIGCLLCVLGSIIIVIHSPKEEEINSFEALMNKLFHYFFISYMASVILMSFIIKAFFVPKFGNSNIVVYLLLCSGIGSLTVVFCKAVALAIKEIITDNIANYKDYMFWVLLIVAIVCIMIQMNYLNKSLDIFNTSVVTPVYYVIFTVLVIVASGILFREWENMEYQDILGCICGFSIVIIAIFMLNAFRDVHVTLKELNLNARRRLSSNIENGEAENTDPLRSL